MFKIIMIGDSGTGKSCLLTRYTKDLFEADYKVTIGTSSFMQEFNSLPRRLTSTRISKLNYRFGTLLVRKVLGQSSKASIEVQLQSSSFTTLQSMIYLSFSKRSF